MMKTLTGVAMAAALAVAGIAAAPQKAEAGCYGCAVGAGCGTTIDSGAGCVTAGGSDERNASSAPQKRRSKPSGADALPPVMTRS